MKWGHALFLTVFLINAPAGFSQYTVTTYAGTGTAGLTNGTITAASFKSPFGMCKDKKNNLYIADNGNHCIRKIASDGKVSTYAGTGVSGYKDGTLSQAMFNSPTNICADDSGNIYVSDFMNHRIRKISVKGAVTTIAGSGVAGYKDGVSAQAQFNSPRGIAVDSDGILYVCDSWNHCIRKITRNGSVTTFAGGGTTKGVNSKGAYLDGKDTVARFYAPSGMLIDKNKNLYVADAYNHRIRKISAAAIVSTACGSGTTGQGKGGYQDGNALSSIFNTPTELTQDVNGNLFISDSFNQRIRVLNTKGVVSTIAGNGQTGSTNGSGNIATFSTPRGLIASAKGDSIFVADFLNNKIRLIKNPSITNGILENSQGEGMLIYPNPVDNEETIKVKAGEKNINGEVIIYSISGQELKRLPIVDNSIRIAEARLTSGTYLCSILVQAQTRSWSKLIVR